MPDHKQKCPPVTPPPSTNKDGSLYGIGDILVVHTIRTALFAHIVEVSVDKSHAAAHFYVLPLRRLLGFSFVVQRSLGSAFRLSCRSVKLRFRSLVKMTYLYSSKFSCCKSPAAPAPKYGNEWHRQLPWLLSQLQCGMWKNRTIQLPIKLPKDDSYNSSFWGRAPIPRRWN